jgi:hypothetical protein
MTNSYRWAWLALACVVVVLCAFLGREHVVRCEDITISGTDYKHAACYVQNRWTGQMELREIPGDWLPSTDSARRANAMPASMAAPTDTARPM